MNDKTTLFGLTAMLSAAAVSGAPGDYDPTKPVRPSPGLFNDWLRQDNPSAAAWDVQLVTAYADHKPEVVVPLSATCLAVMFDDDEKYKAQERTAAPDAKWDQNAAFVGYVRVP